MATVAVLAVTSGWASIAAAAPSTTTPTYGAPSTTAATSAPTTTAPASTTIETSAAPSTTLAPTTAPSAAPTTEAATTTAPAAPETTVPEAAKPFPGALVAPVPAADVPLERAMTDLYVVPGGDADNPQVVVQFRSPFPLPDHPYRVSVVLGDPYGVRVRYSLIGDGSPNPTWRIERAPANPAAPVPGVGTAQPTTPAIWDTMNARGTGAVFSPTGQVTIDVPMKDAPDGTYVWATVETGTDGRQVNTSPLYSRAALFARTPPAYPLPSTTLGQLSEPDGTFLGQFVTLPPGPSLTVKDHAIVVATTERPPTDLAGQKVSKVVDIVRVAPSFDTRGVVTDYVSIDRTTGEVTLLDGMAIPPRDRTGDRAWLTGGLTPGDPAAPGTVEVDLAKMVDALGIDVSPSTTAIGIRRQFVLADGHQVVAEAVLGTLGWFDPNALAAVDQPPASSDGAPLGPVSDPESSSPSWFVLAFAAVVVLLLALLIAAVVVRVLRHRRARGDAADQLTAIAVETAEHRAITREERRLATLDVPVVVVDDPPEVETTPVTPPARRPAPVASHAPAAADPPADELDDDLGATIGTAAHRSRPPAPDPRRTENPLAALIDLTDPRLVLVRPPEPPRGDPDEALATLEADFDALTARLRRIEVPAGRRRDFADPDHVEQF